MTRATIAFIGPLTPSGGVKTGAEPAGKNSSGNHHNKPDGRENENATINCQHYLRRAINRLGNIFNINYKKLSKLKHGLDIQSWSAMLGLVRLRGAQIKIHDLFWGIAQPPIRRP
jgi:hypothetical protein